VPVTSVDATRTPASATASSTLATAPTPATASGAATTAKSGPAPETGSLSTFIGKVRELAAQARPERQAIPTIETTDGRLREALAVELVLPTPEHMRAVAAEYRRLGVFDKAHAHLSRALAAGPEDAATLDAIARLWRDSGFPGLGLADAHRAVYFAPDSPEARNTLGTILQALGHRQLAREEYQRAVALNPTAAYALNNLCYASLLDGDVSKASALCHRALEADPTLGAAHNNLALVYEAQGDHAAAGREFAAASDEAGALYNSGIVHLARREYGSAVKAFEAAHALKPSLTEAVARARQAASAAAAAEE
jgi:Flp pilus assembly protein TadD